MIIYYFYDSENDRWNGKFADDERVNYTGYTREGMIENLVRNWNASHEAQLTGGDLVLQETGAW